MKTNADLIALKVSLLPALAPIFPPIFVGFCITSPLLLIGLYLGVSVQVAILSAGICLALMLFVYVAAFRTNGDGEREDAEGFLAQVV